MILAIVDAVAMLLAIVTCAVFFYMWRGERKENRSLSKEMRQLVQTQSHSMAQLAPLLQDIKAGQEQHKEEVIERIHGTGQVIKEHISLLATSGRR